MSDALHVTCVEYTIRVMLKWFESFFARFNNAHLRLFLKIFYVYFAQLNTNPRNIKEKQLYYKLLKNVFLHENKKNYCGSLNESHNLKLLPTDTKSSVSYARNLAIHI